MREAEFDGEVIGGVGPSCVTWCPVRRGSEHRGGPGIGAAGVRPRPVGGLGPGGASPAGQRWGKWSARPRGARAAPPSPPNPPPPAPPPPPPPPRPPRGPPPRGPPGHHVTQDGPTPPITSPSNSASRTTPPTTRSQPHHLPIPLPLRSSHLLNKHTSCIQDHIPDYRRIGDRSALLRNARETIGAAGLSVTGTIYPDTIR